MKRLWIAIALMCVIVAGAAWTMRPAASAAARSQWEYKRAVYVTNAADVDKNIAALGDEGWELVQYEPTGGSAVLGVYLFKRQK